MQFRGLAACVASTKSSIFMRNDEGRIIRIKERLAVLLKHGDVLRRDLCTGQIGQGLTPNPGELLLSFIHKNFIVKAKTINTLTATKYCYCFKLTSYYSSFVAFFIV